MTRSPVQGGIDRGQLRALLKAYARMALRHQITRAGRRQHNRGATILALLAPVFMGVMTGASVFLGIDVLAFGVITHSAAFAFVSITMMAETAHVLFEPTAAEVLAPRPVSARTLFAAHSLQLLGWGLANAILIGAPAAVFGFFARGAHLWLPPVHLLTTLWMAVFATALAVFAAGLVMRLAGPERLDQIVSWAQGLLIAGYILLTQLAPHLSGRVRGQLDTAHLGPWLAWYPPGWFAAADASLGSGEQQWWGVALLGLAVTAALVILSVGRLAEGYSGALSSVSTRAKAPARRTRRHGAALPRSPKLLGWWLGDPVERAAFHLTRSYLARDAELRRRLIPTVAMPVALPILWLVMGYSLSMPYMAIGSVWMTAMITPVVLDLLTRSNHHAAAERFVSAPLASAAGLFHGARKAVLLHVGLPAAIMALALIVIVRPEHMKLLPLAIPGLITLPTISLLSGLRDYLPLSGPADKAGRTASFSMAVTMGIMVLMATIGVGAAVADHFHVLPAYILVEVALVAVAHVTLLRRIAERPIALAS